MNYDAFYQKHSKKFGRYKPAKEIGTQIGEDTKPDFFTFVKKYSGRKMIALDVGCGSGELTKRFGGLFKEVIGVDFMANYIQTANQESAASNVQFMVADCDNLPFPGGYFDVVVSLRGPLSASQKIMNECSRVLKSGGILIEETIGELDKIELKEVFGRGQNYPPKGTKIESIQSLSGRAGFQIVKHKYFRYFTRYKDADEVADLLEMAPIIDHFDRKADNEKLEILQDELATEQGIILSSHRLWWVGKKK